MAGLRAGSWITSRGLRQAETCGNVAHSDVLHAACFLFLKTSFLRSPAGGGSEKATLPGITEKRSFNGKAILRLCSERREVPTPWGLSEKSTGLCFPLSEKGRCCCSPLLCTTVCTCQFSCITKYHRNCVCVCVCVCVCIRGSVVFNSMQPQGL